MTATMIAGGTKSPMNDKDLPASISGERHILQAEEELRLEVPHTSSKGLLVTLLKGSCELWGLELATGQEYSISGGCKLALFTWHGCVLQIDSEAVEISYISDETKANIAYVNTHAQLEARRDEALAKEGPGPKVLILGPPESGKTSLTRVLVAYGESHTLSLICIALSIVSLDGKVLP